MNDNIEKNLNLESLEDSKLEKVSGGAVYDDEDCVEKCPMCGDRLYPYFYDFDDERGCVELWICEQCGWHNDV